MQKNERILIDLGGMNECCTNHALDSLAKAVSGEDGQHDIWEKHHSPFIQSIIELFTKRGLLLIGKVQEALQSWTEGKMHHDYPQHPPRPSGYVQNWTPEQSSLVHLYLTSLPPEQFTFEDWGLLVDYLLHSYMPYEVMRTEAEWMAVRSSIMGRVQAVMDGKGVTVPQADAVVAALPLTVAGAQQTFNFGTKLDAVMAYGQARCLENVVDLTESMRHKIKSALMSHTYHSMQGNVEGKQALQSKLFDEFASINRDWRRIAVTEAGENANQGLMSTLTPGSRVRRVEQYKGACPFCKKIDGRVLKVVPPDAPEKDGDNEVWVGKTNIGRSGAARKRVGDTLVDRTPEEMWWIPAGTVHPHCRGTWNVMPEAGVHDSPEFQKWLDQHFHKVKQA